VLRRRSLFIALGIAATVAAIGTVGVQFAMRPLVTGKWITPEGQQQTVGSFPTNMALSLDGKYVVVTDTSFREYLSVLDADTGELVSRLDFNGSKKALYYGLAFSGQGDETRLFVSRGSEDVVSVYSLDRGKLTLVKDLHNPAPQDGSKLPHHIAGLATNADGTLLYAVNNQTHDKNDFRGSVSVIDVATDKVLRTIPVDGFPLGIAAAGGKLFVTSERDGLVTVVDPEAGAVLGKIETGTTPAYLKLSKDGSKLYCSNSGSDTVSEIDTTSLKVARTILLRPAAFRGLPGSTPLGMDLTPDGKRLFVAMADLNAVAVVDVAKGELEGYLPAGWYPTSVVVSQDGDRLLVANAKGTKVRNPNGSPVRKITRNQYGASILEGTVNSLDLSQELGVLPEHTEQVLKNNRADGYAEASAKAFQNPGIEHVVYIIKENRTYDQVLGDLPRGNNDPSLCLFPREVSPNLHALAERFVHLDNFYVCAEVSADGWNWSTAGIANEYTQRNTFVSYSGRGRSYDFEGTNNGFPASIRGKRDVAEPEGGYLWDAVAKKGLSLRNYGMFVSFDPESGRPDTQEMKGDGVATKPALQNATNLDFRRFDTAYADSEAWVEYNLPPAPRQLAKYGSHGDPARITSWKRDFAEMVKTGKMPSLTLLRLGRDHTAGTTAGQSSPRAMVADNDYAVGQVVEAISNSPFWKKTAIFVVEDDAQAGFDHVDSHRSTAYVISPYIRKATHDSTFYNTDSVLRTMGLLLGTNPMNQYVATATPFGFFGKAASNAAPYKAILPSKAIIGEVNGASAYRAKDSARLLNRFQEESLPDIELNDILWGSIKGPKTPRPTTPNARWQVKEKDGD
jgi:YVTN family beta-propeller protein